MTSRFIQKWTSKQTRTSIWKRPGPRSKNRASTWEGVSRVRTFVRLWFILRGCWMSCRHLCWIPEIIISCLCKSLMNSMFLRNASKKKTAEAAAWKTSTNQFSTANRLSPDFICSSQWAPSTSKPLRSKRTKSCKTWLRWQKGFSTRFEDCFWGIISWRYARPSSQIREMNTKGKLLRFFADLVSEGVDVNNSIKLIMINLKEMNRLWIRIKSIRQFKKVQREKQRMDLKVTVGENVVRLSRLEGVNLELY